MGPKFQTLVRLVVFEVFHIFTPNLGEMIQFDEYFSNGLVQPPTIVVAVWESIDPMKFVVDCFLEGSILSDPKKSHRKCLISIEIFGFSHFWFRGEFPEYLPTAGRM